MTNQSVLANMSDVDEKHLEILMAVVPIVVPIIFTLIIIVGFVGNLLVVLVVILNKKMRNTTNILIFNLAVSKFIDNSVTWKLDKKAFKINKATFSIVFKSFVKSFFLSENWKFPWYWWLMFLSVLEIVT